MKIVIALGGNALGDTPVSQKESCVQTAKFIAEIIALGHDVVLTHGNGPQIGLIDLAFTEGNKVNDRVYQMPFVECVALTQGYIGYHLQNGLMNELAKLGIKRDVVSVVTQIEVDENDKAFLDPTKPIGPYYTKEEAMKLPYVMKDQGAKGYRRVVASPKPVRIVEESAILSLIKDNKIVIACGGGGIPVVKKETGFEGIPAIIDKDYASSLLARSINADCLFILTAISTACLNYGTPLQQDLHNVSVEDMIKYNEQGHFKAGSMKPKVEGAIEFVKHRKGNVAYITSIEHALDALNGLDGTIIK